MKSTATSAPKQPRKCPSVARRKQAGGRASIVDPSRAVLVLSPADSVIEVVMSGGRAVAYVIAETPSRSMPILELVYAMAPEKWKCAMKLVRQWGCWAVICAEEWAAFMDGRAKPQGRKISVVG